MTLDYAFMGLEDIKPYVNPDDYEDVQDTLNWEILGHNISQLPRDIRGKLYIYAMRKFWKDYIPDTAKIPIWYSRKLEIDRLLWNARFNNVHFLHLPFNTIPENKAYIYGCTCGDCFKMKIMKQMRDHDIPKQIIPHSGMEDGITYWDEDDRELRINWPGQKINIDYKYKYSRSLAYKLRNPEKHQFEFSWEPPSDYTGVPTEPFTFKSSE